MAGKTGLAVLQGIAQGLQQTSALWMSGQRDLAERRQKELWEAFQRSLLEKQEARSQQSFEMEKAENERRLQEVADENARVDAAKKTYLATYKGLSDSDASALARGKPASPAGQRQIETAELEQSIATRLGPRPSAPSATQSAAQPMTGYDEKAAFYREYGDVNPVAYQQKLAAQQQMDLATKAETRAQAEEARRAKDAAFAETLRSLQQRQQEAATDMALLGLNEQQKKPLKEFMAQMVAVSQVDYTLTTDARKNAAIQQLNAAYRQLSPEFQSSVASAVDATRSLIQQGEANPTTVFAMVAEMPLLAGYFVDKVTDPKQQQVLESIIEQEKRSRYPEVVQNILGMAAAANDPELGAPARAAIGRALAQMTGAHTTSEFAQKYGLFETVLETAPLTEEQKTQARLKYFGVDFGGATGAPEVSDNSIRLWTQQRVRANHEGNQESLRNFLAVPPRLPIGKKGLAIFTEQTDPSYQIESQIQLSNGMSRYVDNPEFKAAIARAVVQGAKDAAGGNVQPVYWLSTALQRVGMDFTTPEVRDALSALAMSEGQYIRQSEKAMLGTAAQEMRDVMGMLQGNALPLSEGEPPATVETPPRPRMAGLREYVQGLPAPTTGNPAPQNAPTPSAAPVPRAPSAAPMKLSLEALGQRDATVSKQLDRLWEQYGKNFLLSPEGFAAKVSYVLDKAFGNVDISSPESEAFITRSMGAYDSAKKMLEAYRQKYAGQAAKKKPAPRRPGSSPAPAFYTSKE